MAVPDDALAAEVRPPVLPIVYSCTPVVAA